MRYFLLELTLYTLYLNAHSCGQLGRLTGKYNNHYSSLCRHEFGSATYLEIKSTPTALSFNFHEGTISFLLVLYVGGSVSRIEYPSHNLEIIPVYYF